MDISVPNSISWSVTDECNLKCKHCYSYQEAEKKNTTTTEEMFSIIDLLKKYNVFRVTLTGGEPLLRDDIYKIIEKLKLEGFTVDINTNGILIDREKAKLLKQININDVRISLDGSNKITHDKIRGINGAFDKAIRAIYMLKEEGINTNIATVPNQFNKNEVKDMGELVNKLEIKQWHFFRLILTGNALNNRMLLLNKGEYFNYIKDVVNIQKKYNYIQIMFNDPIYFFFNDIINTFGCGAGKVYLSLDTIGDFHLCPSNPKVIGNIFKDDLRKIWKNDILCKIRSRNLIKECSQCKFKEFCGGCCANSYSKYGEEYTKDPYCIKSL